MLPAAVTRDIHVGSPSPDFKEKLDESVTIHFHSFASLTTEKDKSVKSPTFNCLGFDWSLKIYPGGRSKSDDGMIACVLLNKSPTKIVSVKLDIVLKRQSSYQSKSITHTFASGKGFGLRNFVDRSQVMNDVTLTFVIRIRPDRSNYHFTDILLPKFKLFGDTKSTDVSFLIEGHVLHAHLDILRTDAPVLAQIAEESDKKNHIPLALVDHTIFEIMLKTLYGGSVTDDTWKLYTREIIEYSTKFGFSALKAEAEAWREKERAAQASAAAAAAALAAAAAALASAAKTAGDNKMDDEICIMSVLNNDEVLAKRLDMAMKKGEVIEIDD
jgi:hypothetical protein